MLSLSSFVDDVDMPSQRMLFGLWPFFTRLTKTGPSYTNGICYERWSTVMFFLCVVRERSNRILPFDRKSLAMSLWWWECVSCAFVSCGRCALFIHLYQHRNGRRRVRKRCDDLSPGIRATNATTTTTATTCQQIWSYEHCVHNVLLRIDSDVFAFASGLKSCMLTPITMIEYVHS